MHRNLTVVGLGHFLVIPAGDQPAFSGGQIFEIVGKEVGEEQGVVAEVGIVIEWVFLAGRFVELLDRIDQISQPLTVHGRPVQDLRFNVVA